MKDFFCVNVLFEDIPKKPYEWDKCVSINGIKVKRVTTKLIRDILLYESKLNIEESLIILTDCKTSLAIRLDKNRNIIKRSFLFYDDDLDVCIYACTLNVSIIEYETFNKLEYSQNNETELIKRKLIEIVKKDKLEDKSKYIYYLYYNNVNDYSKDLLVKSISQDKTSKYYEIYEKLFLN